MFSARYGLFYVAKMPKYGQNCHFWRENARNTPKMQNYENSNIQFFLNPVLQVLAKFQPLRSFFDGIYRLLNTFYNSEKLKKWSKIWNFFNFFRKFGVRANFLFNFCKTYMIIQLWCKNKLPVILFHHFIAQLFQKFSKISNTKDIGKLVKIHSEHR